jgi:hypothetical protein
MLWHETRGGASKGVESMKTQKGLPPVLSLILGIFFLSQCDACESGSSTSDFAETATVMAIQETLVAQGTATAAPLVTWTAQANQKLTALPANETATGAAMGATETRAAVATQQLFTREAQTVSTNLTATKIALERGTNTPTATPTASPTATFTPSPSPAPASAVLPPTILNPIANKLPIDQIFGGQTPSHAGINVTDKSIIYSSQRVDFLRHNNGNTLINNWQTSDTSFTFVGNRFPTNNLLTQWQDLSLASPPDTAANDQRLDLAPDSNVARFQNVFCKTGGRTRSGRQFNTGYCDIFYTNVHFGFNFLTTGDIQAVMNANAPLIFKTLAENLK